MMEGENGEGAQEAGIVDASAAGDVYLDLTAVRINEVESMENVTGDSGKKLELDLTNITSKNGDVTLNWRTAATCTRRTASSR